MDDGRPPMKEIRLSDADREAVIAQLREATDEGRITLLEFEDRAGQVYAAQYPSDLRPITADLPVPASQLPAPQSSAIPQDVVTEPMAADKPRWSVQILGENKRRGDWNTGSRTKAVTLVGSQLLDLTEVTASEVVISSYHFIGSTEIIVPDGATVELDGFSLIGGLSNNTSPVGPNLEGQASSKMVVRIRAYGTLGGCTVRNLKRRERKKRGLPRQ